MQGQQDQMTDSDDKTTHFGFETVQEADKAGRVRGVFSSVASKYDVMNDVMSGGIHRIWKDAMMDWLAPRAGQKLLDVGGGTGDIAFRFLRRAGSGHATVLDLTEPMLIEGRKRAEADKLADSLDWVVGDAMALPFEDILVKGRAYARLGALLEEAGPVIRSCSATWSGNWATIRPASEMSRVSTSMPAAPANALTMGNNEYVASAGASSVWV